MADLSFSYFYSERLKKKQYHIINMNVMRTKCSTRNCIILVLFTFGLWCWNLPCWARNAKLRSCLVVKAEINSLPPKTVDLRKVNFKSRLPKCPACEGDKLIEFPNIWHFNSTHPTGWVESISGIGLTDYVCPSIITSKMVNISARRLHRPL